MTNSFDWKVGTVPNTNFRPSSLSSNPIIDVSRLWDPTSSLNWEMPINFGDIPEITVTTKPFTETLPFWDRLYYNFIDPILPDAMKGTSTQNTGSGSVAVKPNQMGMMTFGAVAALGIGMYLIAKGAK